MGSQSGTNLFLLKYTYNICIYALTYTHTHKHTLTHTNALTFTFIYKTSLHFHAAYKEYAFARSNIQTYSTHIPTEIHTKHTHQKTYTHTRTHAHTPHTPKQLHLQNTINRKTDLFKGFL